MVRAGDGLQWLRLWTTGSVTPCTFSRPKLDIIAECSRLGRVSKRTSPSLAEKPMPYSPSHQRSRRLLTVIGSREGVYSCVDKLVSACAS